MISLVGRKITQEFLREVLFYDKQRGLLLWRVAVNARSPAGSPAGSKNGSGYIQIGIGGVIYPAHRLIWVWMTGDWPTHEIDHINGARDDNAWTNLREATSAQNHQNRHVKANNTTGVLGVHINSKYKKYVAQIKINGKTMPLGQYDTLEAAQKAYLRAKERLHEFHPKPRGL